MTIGTVLTLYVVPTVYTLMRQWLDRGSAHGKAAPATRDAAHLPSGAE